ncbi:TRAP transporter small permease [Pseudohoeflea coraliihabitans]|uniref:TRAP transporter small permease protein n=1 Tax=Pseudohoeflea coraliihabitans TaxID=2860393 RepID=A0ABS6WRA5_9HYPH|nr:TRAP transporter small permease [Pseudohoeflea sp. DP4N28-3]MBW3098315.1 TRAP transporter small permease [Pseudohoeflea sp. DP4N28-3]
MPRFLSTCRTQLGRLNRIFAMLSGLALLLMMLLGAFDVIGSSMLNAPLPGAFEATETLMVIAVFLALGLSQQRRAHISVEVLVGLMPTILQRFSAIFSALLCALFFGLVAWFGWTIAIKSTLAGEFSSGLINFPVWPAKIALALGASLMTLQCLFDVVAVFAGEDETPPAPAPEQEIG